jgi:hypothetical protein
LLNRLIRLVSRAVQIEHRGGKIAFPPGRLHRRRVLESSLGELVAVVTGISFDDVPSGKAQERRLGPARGQVAEGLADSIHPVVTDGREDVFQGAAGILFLVERLEGVDPQAAGLAAEAVPVTVYLFSFQRLEEVVGVGVPLQWLRSWLLALETALEASLKIFNEGIRTQRAFSAGMRVQQVANV